MMREARGRQQQHRPTEQEQRSSHGCCEASAAATDPTKSPEMNLAVIEDDLSAVSQRHVDSRLLAEEGTIPIRSILRHSIADICLRRNNSVSTIDDEGSTTSALLQQSSSAAIYHRQWRAEREIRAASGGLAEVRARLNSPAAAVEMSSARCATESSRQKQQQRQHST